MYPVADQTMDRQKVVQPSRVQLTDINQHLICPLCCGYLIDATTIVECLHSYCRSCIIKFLKTSPFCPKCEVMINPAKPDIKLDKTLQDVVYKLVPELHSNEMQRRRAFYKNRATRTGKRLRRYPRVVADSSSDSSSDESTTSSGVSEPDESGPNKVRICSPTPEQRGEDIERVVVNSNDKFSVVLEWCSDDEIFPFLRENCFGLSVTAPFQSLPNQITSPTKKDRCVENDSLRLYLSCPARTTIRALKKLLIDKYQVDLKKFKVNLFYKRVALPDHYMLMDIAYIYSYKFIDPLNIYYQIADRQRRRATKPPTRAIVDETIPPASDASVKLARLTPVEPETVPVVKSDVPVASKNDDDEEKSQFLNKFELTSTKNLDVAKVKTPPVSPRTTPASPRTTPASPRTTPASPRTTPASPRTTPASPRTTPASPRTSPKSTPMPALVKLPTKNGVMRDAAVNGPSRKALASKERRNSTEKSGVGGKVTSPPTKKLKKLEEDDKRGDPMGVETNGNVAGLLKVAQTNQINVYKNKKLTNVTTVPTPAITTNISPNAKHQKIETDAILDNLMRQELLATSLALKNVQKSPNQTTNGVQSDAKMDVDQPTSVKPNQNPLTNPLFIKVDAAKPDQTKATHVKRKTATDCAQNKRARVDAMKKTAADKKSETDIRQFFGSIKIPQSLSITTVAKVQDAREIPSKKIAAKLDAKTAVKNGASNGQTTAQSNGLVSNILGEFKRNVELFTQLTQQKRPQDATVKSRLSTQINQMLLNQHDLANQLSATQKELTSHMTASQRAAYQRFQIAQQPGNLIAPKTSPKLPPASPKLSPKSSYRVPSALVSPNVKQIPPVASVPLIKPSGNRPSASTNSFVWNGLKTDEAKNALLKTLLTNQIQQMAAYQTNHAIQAASIPSQASHTVNQASISANQTSNSVNLSSNSKNQASNSPNLPLNSPNQASNSKNQASNTPNQASKLSNLPNQSPNITQPSAITGKQTVNSTPMSLSINQATISSRLQAISSQKATNLTIQASNITSSALNPTASISIPNKPAASSPISSKPPTSSSISPSKPATSGTIPNKPATSSAIPPNKPATSSAIANKPATSSSIPPSKPATSSSIQCKPAASSPIPSKPPSNLTIQPTNLTSPSVNQATSSSNLKPNANQASSTNQTVKLNTYQNDTKPKASPKPVKSPNHASTSSATSSSNQANKPVLGASCSIAPVTQSLSVNVGGGVAKSSSPKSSEPDLMKISPNIPVTNSLTNVGCTATDGRIVSPKSNSSATVDANKLKMPSPRCKTTSSSSSVTTTVTPPKQSDSNPPSNSNPLTVQPKTNATTIAKAQTNEKGEKVTTLQIHKIDPTNPASAVVIEKRIEPASLSTKIEATPSQMYPVSSESTTGFQKMFEETIRKKLNLAKRRSTVHHEGPVKKLDESETVDRSSTINALDLSGGSGPSTNGSKCASPTNGATVEAVDGKSFVSGKIFNHYFNMVNSSMFAGKSAVNTAPDKQ